jgi:hypothetical protein
MSATLSVPRNKYAGEKEKEKEERIETNRKITKGTRPLSVFMFAIKVHKTVL